MKTKTKLIVALGALLSTASPAVSQSPSPNLDFAMRAMLQGPQVKSVKIHGHKFNIKPARITRNGSTVTAKIHISHTYKYLRDDQVYVTLTKVDGKLQGEPQIKIKYRGWKEAKRVASWAWKIGKWIYKNAVQEKNDMRDPGKTLTQLRKARQEIWAVGKKPKWETVVNALINEFVMRLGTNGKDRMHALVGRLKRPVVIAFRDGSYRGPGLELFRSSRSTKAQGLGDSISSIHIPRGCTVTLYEHSNFRGRSIRLTSSVASLKKLRRGKKRWNDCVSSVRVSHR